MKILNLLSLEMIKKMGFAALIAGSFWGCSKANLPQTDGLQSALETGSGHPQGSRTLLESTTVRILDDNAQPVVGAEVLVGTGQNSPFVGNFVKTGSDGRIPALSGWKSALPVTISAPGFVRASYWSQVPLGQDLTIRHEAPKAQFELKGTTPGMTPVDGSGICDFSVVIPALKRADILRFDINKFISPQVDTISIMGQSIHIPSNVTLPKQQQSYIFPITIEKPAYRIYFGAKGTQKVFTIHGQFPFNDVVDKMQNGSQFYDVINEFTMINGNLVDASINQDSQSLVIPVTGMAFSSTVTVKAPALGDDEALLAAAVGEQGDFYFPTDVKNVPSQGTIALKSLSKKAGSRQWLAVLKKKDPNAPMNGVSAALQDFDGKAANLLPLFANPSVESKHSVKWELPQAPASIEKFATYATLSNLEAPATETGLPQESLVWEVFAPNWIGEIQLPTWPGEALLDSAKQRWAVALLGAPPKTPVDLGPGLLQSVTHVTRSTSDF